MRPKDIHKNNKFSSMISMITMLVSIHSILVSKVTCTFSFVHRHTSSFSHRYSSSLSSSLSSRYSQSYSYSTSNRIAHVNKNRLHNINTNTNINTGVAHSPFNAFRNQKLTALHVSTSTSSSAADTNSDSNSNSNSNSNNDEEPKPVIVPRKFQPFPFQYHEVLTLKVESLTNRGIGICRAEIDMPLPESDDNNNDDTESSNTIITNNNNNDDDDKTSEKNKWVVMVPSVIPGEIITCKIYRNYKTYSDADLLSIIEPSPNRIPTSNIPCPLFTECGGCQYQHMDIETQRKWKFNQVQDLLERIGNFDTMDFVDVMKDTVGTDEIYHYRSKITPHYDRPIKVSIEDDGDNSNGNGNRNGNGNASGNNGTEEKIMKIRAIGFKKKTNRQIVDVPYCHIATEDINNKLSQVREDKYAEAREGRLKRPKKGATLLLRDAHQFNEDDERDRGTNDDGNDDEGIVEDISVVETDPNVYVKTKVKGLTFRFLAGNFFQNNPFMLPVMVDHVVEAAVEPNASGDKMTHLIDCYCGSGLFCLSSSSHFDVCVGIEINEKAIEEASRNAAINKITNCKFVSASAEAIFMSNDTVDIFEGNKMSSTLVREFPKSTTTVVIDPPRKGCSTEFLDQLYKFSPERVVYMSCDPATQARDAEGIVEAGYVITSVQPYDLFPQTRHIENLIVFEKKHN